MNSNYYDNYKKYNYWHQRFQLNPNGAPSNPYLIWYYNYYYPYAQRGIQTPGYLNNPNYMFMGHAPNDYRMKR